MNQILKASNLQSNISFIAIFVSAAALFIVSPGLGITVGKARNENDYYFKDEHLPEGSEGSGAPIEDCEWTDWTSGQCTCYCGIGKRTKSRTIKNEQLFLSAPNAGMPCMGDPNITESCVLPPCTENNIPDAGNKAFCAEECIPTGKLCDLFTQCLHEHTWKCGTECINRTEACEENCYYDKEDPSNYDSKLGLLRNIPIYCRNTNECILYPQDNCNFTSSSADNCLISKEVCTSTELKQRSCGNDMIYQKCWGHWSGQCIRRGLAYNRVYNCLDRSDEYIAKIMRSELKVFYRINLNAYNLTTCVNEEGRGGLWCGNSSCIPYENWCKDDLSPETLQCRIINSAQICTNITFWREILREKNDCFPCSGTRPGECISSNNVCDNNTDVFQGNCYDKTDEICDDIEKCTHFGYKFCENGNLCIHPNLWCDGVINCPDGSDEIPGDCGTLHCDTPEFRRLSKSFPCKHRFTNSSICATMCNNVVECIDNLDEKNCSNSYFIIAFWVLLGCVSISTIFSECILKFSAEQEEEEDEVFLQDRRQINDTMSLILIFQNLSLPTSDSNKAKMIFRSLHQSPNYGHHLTLIISYITMKFKERKKIEALRYLYNLEYKSHESNFIETEECMKQNVGTNSLCQAILDAQYSGLLDKLPQKIKTVKHLITTNFWFISITIYLKIANYYFDLSKDIILLGAICYSVSVTSLDAKSFTMQLIISYILSISIPLLINGIQIILYNLEVACGNFNENFSPPKKIVFGTLMFFFSPFIPGIVIYQIAKKQQCIYKIFEKMSNNVKIEKIVSEENIKSVDTSIKLNSEKQKLEVLLTNFTRIELLEVMLQTVIALCLFSMNYKSASLNYEGLQEFFDEEPWYFPLAIFLSIKKILTTSLNVKNCSKCGFQTIKGILIYGVYSLIGPLIRICAICLYFAVPLGLFNILIHWVYEVADYGFNRTITWQEYEVNSDGSYDYERPVKFSIYDPETNDFEIIYLKNITSELLTKEPYTKYTGFSLSVYYALFIIGVIIHCLVVAIYDWTSQPHKYLSEFSDSGENKVPLTRLESQMKGNAKNADNIFIHCFTTIVISDVLKDWDEYDGAERCKIDSRCIVKTYQRKWRKMKRDYMFLLVLQLIENMLLVCPILYTYTNVKTRHQFLKDTIGPVPLEIDSMETVYYLAICAPLIIILSVLLQCLLIWIYNKYGHPWERFFNEIFKDEKNVGTDNIPLSVQKGASYEADTIRRWLSEPTISIEESTDKLEDKKNLNGVQRKRRNTN